VLAKQHFHRRGTNNQLPAAAARGGLYRAAACEVFSFVDRFPRQCAQSAADHAAVR
jgi:hypothetical protein